MCSRLEPSAPPAFTSPRLFFQPNIPPLAAPQGHPTGQWRFQRRGPWEWGFCSGTRPVNFAVESPLSVGGGRYFFKWTADFETAGRGGLSGKGTQPPLLELPRSLPFPSTRAPLGQRPRRPLHLPTPPPAGTRGACTSRGAHPRGESPHARRPPRLRRGRPALSAAASRSGARALPHFPVCSL